MSAPVTLIGNVNVDLVMGPLAPWPRAGTELVLPMSDLRVGGAAGNAALALTALGAPHRIVASRGDDVFGRWLAEPFGEEARGWTVAPVATTMSVGLTHPDGERTFLTTVGHLHAFRLADVEAQLPDRAAPGEVALLLGCFVSPLLLAEYGTLIGRLRRRGFAIAIDTGWPDDGWTAGNRALVEGWLASCDHLLVNDIEARGLAGIDDLAAAAARLAALLPTGATLVVKRGPDGALARRGGTSLDRPAPHVTVLDTIGAGDIFDAGYLASLAAGADLASAIDAGIAAASLAVSTRPRRYRA